MGTFVRFPVWPRWAILVALVAACPQIVPQALPDAAIIKPASIESTYDTVAIPPGGSRQLRFRLLGSQDEPVPGAAMRFSIIDDDETPGSGGAQLSFLNSLTDSDGTIILQILAGKGRTEQQPLTFSLRAAAETLVLDVPIFITSNPLASVQIMPVFPEGTDDPPVAMTYLSFFDGTSCAGLSLDSVPLRGVRNLPAESGPATFSSVVTSGIHAVNGVAVGMHSVEVARGCADVLGTSLSPDQTRRVLLPLARLNPAPTGVYRAVSQFNFSPPLPGTVSARSVWKDLSDDACDPAHLWLDCTIDALSGSSADDPLDCEPVAGGEGLLGTLLSTRRSTAGESLTCASHLDAARRPSLDAQTYALFPPGPLAALRLAKLPDELTTTLTTLSIESTLLVSATSIPYEFNIDHTLTALDLPNAAFHSSISMTALAAPVREAPFVYGTTHATPLSLAGQLSIALQDRPHWFTLGLGAAARFTFATSSLAPRLGIADVSSFVTDLVQLATRKEGETVQTGCAALDALLCDDVGEPRGCMTAACLSGLEALTKKLETSFTALDGVDLDFSLYGKATPVDRNGDRKADSLSKGWWSGTFKGRKDGSGKGTPVYGSWTAERLSDK
jgi:hypothetical protein